MGNSIQSHLGVEGSLGGVFCVSVAIKTRVEKNGRKGRNDAYQHNDGNEFDESEAFLLIHDKCFGLDTDFHRFTRIKISGITNWN